MTSIEFYERDTVVKFVKNSLNQINKDCFEGNHGIIAVTDNGDYFTVKGQGSPIAYNPQKLWDALEAYSQDDCAKFYDLWDYLQSCEYIPENQETENDKLSFSEKRQVALVNMLLSEPVSVPITESSSLDDWTISLISQSQTIHTQVATLSELVEELEQKNKILWEKNRELEQNKEQYEAGIDILNQRVHDLESTVYLLQQETNQITVLNESVTQLHIRIYELEQENKQLKNQSEPQPETKPEPKPTAKKRPKFKLPENFADYQQECDNLINALSCFYDIKKGKWNGNILQFILTPAASQKENYPDKWKAGLYLQPGQWTVDKASMSDPDSWQDWFMDINDFADANGIEIS